MRQLLNQYRQCIESNSPAAAGDLVETLSIDDRKALRALLESDPKLKQKLVRSLFFCYKTQIWF